MDIDYLLKELLKWFYTSNYFLIINNCHHFKSRCFIRCTNILNSEGKVESFSKAQIDSIVKNVVEQMACEGLRTICVAYRDFPEAQSNF